MPFVTSPGKWQKSLACAASVADVVCLRAVACRRSSARRAARLLSLAAPGRSPGALARGRSGRGARAPQRSEERRGPRPCLRARSASTSAPRRRSRRLRCSMAWRVRERRVQALQRPSVASSARTRRCRPNSVRPQGVAAASVSEVEAMPRRRAGPPRSEAERFISAGAAQSSLGPRGAARRATGGGPRRCLWRAPCSRPHLPRPARRSRRGRLPVPRRPLAPCVLRSGRALRRGRNTRVKTRARFGRRDLLEQYGTEPHDSSLKP